MTRLLCVARGVCVWLGLGVLLVTALASPAFNLKAAGVMTALLECRG